ncbi:MAG: NUDIX domain-containing protein [Candidatus Taylorbacteria bacterium]|nr:NUDIX domain-containing protein [Candidatus Taylorbacteria bacterium]
MEFQRNRKPFTPEEFKGIYSKVPRVTVDLIIKTPKGVVLTLRTHYSWKNQWHFPGGTVFYKESVTQAIDRVAQDEIGTSVEVIKLLGYIEYPSEEEQRGFGSTVSLAFLCKTSETAFTVNEDASRIEVFTTPPDHLIAEQAEFLKTHWDTIQEDFKEI